MRFTQGDGLIRQRYDRKDGQAIVQTDSLKPYTVIANK